MKSLYLNFHLQTLLVFMIWTRVCTSSPHISKRDTVWINYENSIPLSIVNPISKIFLISFRILGIQFCVAGLIMEDTHRTLINATMQQ